MIAIKKEDFKTGTKLYIDLDGTEFKSNVINDKLLRELIEKFIIYNREVNPKMLVKNEVAIKDNTNIFAKLLFKLIKNKLWIKTNVVKSFMPIANSKPYFYGVDEIYSSIVNDEKEKDFNKQVEDIVNESK